MPTGLCGIVYDMTRKHFEKFAALFAGELSVNRDNPSAVLAIRALIMSTADIFAQDNPRFDRERFYLAAGLRTSEK